jgi:hypothetical protein
MTGYNRIIIKNKKQWRPKKKKDRTKNKGILYLERSGAGRVLSQGKSPKATQMDILFWLRLRSDL